MQRRTTISDVARLAEVSITTVSRVVNASAPVAPATVERVQQAISALNYTPSAAARSLAGQKTSTIGLYLPQISGPFFAAFLQGVEEGARECRFDLTIHAHAQSLDGEGGMVLPLGSHNTDGLIVFTGALPEETVLALHEQGFPMILLFHSPPPGTDIPTITLENRESAAALVGHLIEAHGRRRIAFLRGPAGNQDSAERELGYRDALAAHDLPYDPSLTGFGNFRDIEAHDTVSAWLRDGLSFDGLFAGDDESASSAMLALREAGSRVPEDVAVVGFDDVSYARMVTPPLTTVRSPIEAAGLAAARELASLIRTGTAQLQQQFPTELVIRQSCGCP